MIQITTRDRNRLAKKVKAGARFIQTQPVFDIELFRKYMAEARERGLDQECGALAGIMPIKSIMMAKYLREKIAGTILPAAIIERLERSTESHKDRAMRARA